MNQNPSKLAVAVPCIPLVSPSLAVGLAVEARFLMHTLLLARRRSPRLATVYFRTIIRPLDLNKRHRRGPPTADREDANEFTDAREEKFPSRTDAPRARRGQLEDAGDALRWRRTMHWLTRGPPRPCRARRSRRAQRRSALRELRSSGSH
jgi:hypothetical protein